MAFVSLFTVSMVTFTPLSVAVVIILRSLSRFLWIWIVLTSWFTVVLAFVIMILIRVIFRTWPIVFIIIFPWAIPMIRILEWAWFIHIIQSCIFLVIVFQTFLIALIWFLSSTMMPLMLILLHYLRLLFRCVSIRCQMSFILRPLISQVRLLWRVRVRSILPSILFIFRFIICSFSTVSRT